MLFSFLTIKPKRALEVNQFDINRSLAGAVIPVERVGDSTELISNHWLKPLHNVTLAMERHSFLLLSFSVYLNM